MNKLMKKVLGKMVKQEIRICFYLVLSIVASIVFTCISPLYLEKAVNSLLDHQGLAFSIIFLYFFTLIAGNIADSLKEVSITYFGQRMTHLLRSELLSKLNRLPFDYFVKHEKGKTISYLTSDVESIETLFSSGIISMFADCAKVFSVFAIVFTKSVGLGFMLLFCTPLLMYLTRAFQKRMLSQQLVNRKAVSEMNQKIPETIHNLRTIQIYDLEENRKENLNSSLLKSFTALEKANFYDAIYSPIVIMISALVVAMMMLFAATNGSLFSISVGSAVAMIAYVSKVFDPLENIGMEIQNIQSSFAGIQRVESFYAEAEMAEKIDDDYKNQVAVEIEQCSFGYDENLLFNQFDLVIHENDHVMIKGRTGAGKSTLFKLILGNYPLQSGTISVYGKDVRALKEEEKRGLLGVVEQQFSSIRGTVKEQITLMDERIGDDDVQRALDLVGLDVDMNKKFDEKEFSQGEKQLLSIARAVVSNPKILLLDEITANLDTLTEQRIYDALLAACENRTVLNISHRTFSSMTEKIVQL